MIKKIQLKHLKEALECDLTLEQSGVWITDVFGLRWKIKRLNYFRNEQYRLNLEALKEEGLEEKELEEKQKALIRVFVKTCLLDWEGLTDDDDEQIPFDEETVSGVLYSMPDLYEQLKIQATNASHFKKEQDIKNLSTASSGISSKQKKTSKETSEETSSPKRTKKVAVSSNP